MAESEAVQDFSGAGERAPSAWTEVAACLLLPGKGPQVWEECWERDGGNSGVPTAGRGQGTLARTLEGQGQPPPPHPHAAFRVQFLKAVSPGPPASAPWSQLPPPAQAQLLLIFSSISFLPGRSKQPLARFPSYQFLRDNVPSWLSGVSPLNRDDSFPGSRPARPTGQHPRLFATSPASDPRDPAPRGQLRLPWPE